MVPGKCGGKYKHAGSHPGRCRHRPKGFEKNRFDRIGIPGDNVPRYDTTLKSDNYLVIAHCTADEVIIAKEIFDFLQVADIAVHHA